MILLASPGSS